MINLPPALIFILGAFLIPLLKGKMKQAYMLLLPVIGFINLLGFSEGAHFAVSFLDYNLVFGRIDKLSLAFGYIFTLITFISILYSIHVKDNGQHIAGLLYAGGALGAVFAGDYISLFIFWELMAFAAAYIVWASRTEASRAAGLRYLLVHIFGGLCLLSGIIINVYNTGSIEFGYLGLNGLASYLILLGFGINAAFPVLHAWLPDAYPEATFSGAVFLSAFTTKTAVYVLARGFPGTEILIWIGAAMTAFPIFYAVIENNMRKVLSYSLINQVGFMITGIGIGTALSLNGTVAHAFAHILYKALLFMSMGAVLHQTGKINATDLGGLYKTMPLTTIFCIIGAASISGFPLTSGFVSKSMIVSASGIENLTIIWFLLIFASAGVFHHSGIKIPFFAFFSHDSGIRTTEPPKNMLIAMGIAAFFCIAIGVFPGPLYSILPYPVDYVPYTGAHVIDQLQLLAFSALAFTLLMLSGIYPAEMRATNLDADWFYRKGAKAFMWFISNPMARLSERINRAAFDILPS
ncbi:MAG: Na(+)/H(+) antiporter subunit D, partial [Candidatus Aenigmarchaeota archaeon]|nr:Na(+)/H(+) antiporter subunit D [Candidatus Aenigmarchaeota archaeon]